MGEPKRYWKFKEAGLHHLVEENDAESSCKCIAYVDRGVTGWVYACNFSTVTQHVDIKSAKTAINEWLAKEK